MKGIILAGGLGTRLYPLTWITNKHLLPVYNKPMIYYPIEALLNAGIRDILIVTGGKHAGDFLPLLRNGEAFGLRQIRYAHQAGEGGIAEALRYAESFAAGDKICVVLGDNIIETNFLRAAQNFARQKEGAKILLKEVQEPQRFGVPVFSENRLVAIEEKPIKPASSYAVVGIYFYDACVFDIIRTLKPSGRDELEITDVNNTYLRNGLLTWEILEGWWTDAGTFDSLLQASQLVAETGANCLCKNALDQCLLPFSA
jgi:glucose-1-phosphate thymidylyltransferase